MFCTKCGAEVKKDSKFCAYCGNDLSSQAEKVKKQTKKEEEKKEEKKEEVKVEKVELKEVKQPEVKKTTTQATTNVTDGKATASLVLGICSFVLFCLMLPLSLIGLILGIASKERSGKRTAGIVINAIALALSILATSIIILPFFTIRTTGSTNSNFFEELMEKLEEIDRIESNSQYNYQYNNQYNSNSQSKQETKKDVQIIGNDKYGYLEIPKSWREYRDEDPAPGVIQYTDIGDKGYIITMNVYDEDISASTASTNIYNLHKEEGRTPTRSYTTLDRRFTYVISTYYSEDGTYLNQYIFKASDGKLHYIAIEGPNKYNDYFKIPETFKMTK